MGRTLEALVALAGTVVAMGAHAENSLDVRRLEAAGVRVLEGRHVQLLTDLPSNAAVDELPAVFDAAVPLWASYFKLPEGATDGKHWQACLMRDRELFGSLGLLPEDNPRFINGYARDGRLWLVEQPSDYYRRHLLLHEGTHAFMQTMLGGCGDGWYMEGMAELLGTHSWKDGKLQLNVFPADKRDVPMWGRIKLVRDAVAAGTAWPLEAVLAVDNTRALSTDHYAWTWALAALLDGHPHFQERFRSLKEYAADEQFDGRFRELFRPDWNDLETEWQAYVATLDYGYDMRRMAIVHRPAQVGRRTPFTVAADLGWQSTGWLLGAGKRYRLTASGRYRIAMEDGRSWPCEPGGVTIEYHDGRPLGVLIGALQPVREARYAEPSFRKPAVIGLGAELTPQLTGMLYVRVNDSPAKLADNEGEVQVTVTQIAPGQ